MRLCRCPIALLPGFWKSAIRRALARRASAGALACLSSLMEPEQLWRMYSPRQPPKRPRADLDFEHRPNPHWGKLQCREVIRVTAYRVKYYHGRDECFKGELLLHARPAFFCPRSKMTETNGWLRRFGRFREVSWVAPENPSPPSTPEFPSAFVSPFCGRRQYLAAVKQVFLEMNVKFMKSVSSGVSPRNRDMAEEWGFVDETRLRDLSLLPGER